MDNQHQRKKRKLKLEHWQVIAICLMVCDFITIHLAYFLALWVRFDSVFSEIPAQYLNSYRHFITPYSAGAIALFWLNRMYKGMWRYASYVELIRTFIGSTIASVLHMVLISVLFGRMPLSYHLWGYTAQLILLIAPRFSFRLLLFFRAGFKQNDENAGRVLIIGAGEAGQMLLRDMRGAKELKDKAVCFIDDNPNKWGRFIEGVPIAGGRDDILSAVERFQVSKIFIAIPSAKAEDKKEILNICNETN